MKIIYDQMPEIQLIVTGSSALHIKNKSTESMAGRKIEYHLYPLTFSEYLVQKGIDSALNFSILENIINSKDPKSHLFSSSEILDHILLYGLYPEVINLTDPRKYLLELADSAIFKDIVELDLIENRSKARELLKLLSYQTGNLINYTEIGSKLALDRRTVERYIDIFEQSFILFRVFPYSQNKRNEIGKMPKIYFYDLGLRNAIIDNFDSSPHRPDRGAMFENYIVAELQKILAYKSSDYNLNYWRLKSGSEVDVVLSNPNNLWGIEVKYNGGSISSAFINYYPNVKSKVITSNNFY